MVTIDEKCTFNSYYCKNSFFYKLDETYWTFYKGVKIQARVQKKIIRHYESLLIKGNSVEIENFCFVSEL